MVAAPAALLNPVVEHRRREDVAPVGHVTSLSANEAADILRSTRRELHPPVELLSEVHGSVLVVLERDRDGVLHGETRMFDPATGRDEVRGWGGLTELTRQQARHLAALHRALRTCGEDGRKLGPSTYRSVAS